MELPAASLTVLFPATALLAFPATAAAVPMTTLLASNVQPDNVTLAVALLLLLLVVTLLLVGPASANDSRMAPASTPPQLTKLEAETVTFAWELPPPPLLPLSGGRGCCRLTTNAVLLQPEKLSPCTVTELVFAENERAVPEPAVHVSRGKAVLVE